MRNNLLNEKLNYNGSETKATEIKLYSYTASTIEERQIPLYEDVLFEEKSEATHWIRIDGLTDSKAIRKVTDQFNISYLLTQDILNVDHLTKVEEYDDFILIVLKYFGWENKELTEEPYQISLVLGENYLISFSERTHPFMETIVDALKEDTLRIRKRREDYLLSVLLNSIVANYTKAILQINDTLEDLEEELLTISANPEIGPIIQSNRKQYLQIKKSLLPLKEQYARLFRADKKFIKPATRVFFNDVNDHLQFVLQHIEISRETLTALVDLYISNNDLKMNNIMKQLTIVATIFIPLTFLVGVWGMNFSNMPELEWKYGYIMAWLIMIIVGLVIYIYFKRKKWN